MPELKFTTDPTPDTDDQVVRVDRRARVELAGRQATILIDGKNIAGGVQRLTVEATPHEMQLTLRLSLPELVVDGDVQVAMSRSTRGALAALGWSEPADTARLRAQRDGLVGVLNELLRTAETMEGWPEALASATRVLDNARDADG